MLVKMLQGMVGEGVSLQSGQAVEVSDVVGKEWVVVGIAEKWSGAKPAAQDVHQHASTASRAKAKPKAARPS